ncbi:MAG: right-handed parallel beta-helix repeat-containing protein [Nitrososphaerota archaeon]|jgi:hypothetical protein|nr:right-handed parallel beta-helix repeat-containing protein [Nitrososphaerota archaeon]
MTVNYRLSGYKLAVILIFFLFIFSIVTYFVLLQNASLDESVDTQAQISTVALNSLSPAQTQTPRKIEILPDGSIVDSNPITPLKRSGNAYTLSGDIVGSIDIMKSGITLDGAGYALRKSDGIDGGILVGIRYVNHREHGVNNVTIKNLQITNTPYSLWLSGSNNIVTNVNITGESGHGGSGIRACGSYNTIQNCHIVGTNGDGIFAEGDNTLIENNVITDNGEYGISFCNNPITLRSNILNNNDRGPFRIYEDEKDASGQPIKLKSGYIDPTNLVEGKPVYYWINEHDKAVPSDAGYVYLDNCKNIVVENIEIGWNSTNQLYTGSTYAINLIGSDNIVVKNNHLNETGISCDSSNKNALICNNTLTLGSIYTAGLSTTILGNSIFQSKDVAIIVTGTDGTTVTQNVLINCDTGISLTPNSASFW